MEHATEVLGSICTSHTHIHSVVIFDGGDDTLYELEEDEQVRINRWDASTFVQCFDDAEHGRAMLAGMY